MKGGHEYGRLINSPEWLAIREVVLQRDKTCVLCGSTDRLSVHHRKYSSPMLNHFFDPDYLVTLCYDCHELVTDTQRRKRYKIKNEWPTHNAMAKTEKIEKEQKVMDWPKSTCLA